MQLKIGTVTDENAVVDKAFNVIRTLDVILEENTSVSDPSFIVTLPSGWSPAQCNYCYAAKLGRYYYINDIEILNGDRIALHCHVDVLKSFSSGIKANYAIIDKTEPVGAWNKYIAGSEYVTENRNKNEVITFSDVSDGFLTNPRYILVVAGGRGDS